MKLQLDFTFASQFQVNYNKPLLTLGSCFAEEVGERLKKHYFKTVLNPNGILFNPISIANALAQYAQKEFNGKVFYHNELWQSWDYHGAFSHPQMEVALAQMKHAHHIAHEHVKQHPVLLITFGSAWVYELVETGQIVANCHKVPSAHFRKRLLSVEEMMKAWITVLEMPAYQNLQVVFTVSPVRYVRDGLVENNRSKARLIELVHALIDKLGNQQVQYFPAYELVIDVLRDYRFYDQDMLHPTEQAVDIVWDKFIQYGMDEPTQQFTQEASSIIVMESHRLLHLETPAAKKFIENLKAKKRAFDLKYSL
jgi:hypothetical protein